MYKTYVIDYVYNILTEMLNEYLVFNSIKII